MSGATGSGGTEAFAQLLRELKDRSGLSYGALAKRLHMSTSTLHRYCNGTAVPVDYAPVERLARVCRATPKELVELHRRWILADAARGRRAEQAAAAHPGEPADARDAADAAETAHPRGMADARDTVAVGEPGPAAPQGRREGENGSEDEDGGRNEGEGENGNEGEGGNEGEDEDDGTGVSGGAGAVDVPPAPPSPWRRHPRRTALVASVAVAAVLGAVVLTVRPGFGGGGPQAHRQASGVTAGATGAADTGNPSARTRGRKPSASASASPTGSGGAGSGASKGSDERTAAKPDGDGATGGVPLTVGVRPYVYDTPCSQHFLVDSGPEQVGPPAGEQDAPRWAAAYGAVSSDEQRIALTVQGTGEDTVVLEALHVRVLAKGAPLAWNDYSMGVGCGGDVETESFDIGLDDGSPAVAVKNGQRDFPYKVSESDPEVFYVTAHTKAHDVRWDLTLDWSSGSRRGTVHIDDGGAPFRTSADVDRPGYDYPPGGGEWTAREG